MPRIRSSFFLACYCLALFLLFDFVYSTYFFVPVHDLSARTFDARYSHGFVPNFSGFDSWGRARYPFYTNNLAFRDGSVRAVSLKPSTYRTLLIGDSFTEAVGVPFEQSFAGLLYHAGQERGDRIEFLNAGVLSYSPVLYYKKIKTLLDSGLGFDEVVVFLDLSDIHDEATTYFCFDDDRKYDVYKVNCSPPDSPPRLVQRSQLSAFRDKLKAHFVVTDRSREMFNGWIRSLRADPKRSAIRNSLRNDWTIPTADVGHRYDPLGIEGGIARARNNMQALADLLAQHHIPLTVVVYPWPLQLEKDDRNGRQSVIWREFCAKNCRSFIDLFPVFFAFKDAHQDWYERLFILGDFHYSAEGNRLVYQNVADRLLNTAARQPAADAESNAKQSR
jgi:hypothetical protein